jgi:hypothetical protein
VLTVVQWMWYLGGKKEKDKKRQSEHHIIYSSNKPTNSLEHSFSSETQGRRAGQ